MRKNVRPERRKRTPIEKPPCEHDLKKVGSRVKDGADICWCKKCDKVLVPIDGLSQ